MEDSIMPQRSSWMRSPLAAVFMIAMQQTAMSAEPPRERTLEEIKEESIGRAERGGYPLIGLDPADVREAFQSIATLDRDEWAAAWTALGDRYYTKAQSAAAAGYSDEARANYLRAWRLYSFGRWPVPSSPGKERAYAKALGAFLAAAKGLDPPLQVSASPSRVPRLSLTCAFQAPVVRCRWFWRSAVSTAARKTSLIPLPPFCPTA
jgi:hypothetical protein